LRSWRIKNPNELSLQQLQDLYDASNDEVMEWMRDNTHLLWEKNTND